MKGPAPMMSFFSEEMLAFDASSNRPEQISENYRQRILPA